MKTGKPITGLYNKINIDYSEQADTEREYPPACCAGKEGYRYANCLRAAKVLCKFILLCLPMIHLIKKKYCEVESF